MRPEIKKGVVEELCKRLVDDGKIVEAGWQSYNHLVTPAGASTIQREETRRAFFAGAQHLFGSIMSILEPGEEPTEADLRRMDAINNELDAYIAEFKKLHNIS